MSGFFINLVLVGGANAKASAISLLPVTEAPKKVTKSKQVASKATKSQSKAAPKAAAPPPVKRGRATRAATRANDRDFAAASAKAVSKENATKLHPPPTQTSHSKKAKQLELEDIFVKKEVAVDVPTVQVPPISEAAASKAENSSVTESDDNSDSTAPYVEFKDMQFTQEGRLSKTELERLTDELLNNNSEDDSMHERLKKEDEEFRRKFLMSSDSDNDD